MYITNRFIWVISISFLLKNALALENSFDEKIPTPTNAIDVKQRTLKPDDGEKMSTLKLTYKLKRKYPDTTVIKFYEKTLIPQGWKLCGRINIESDENSWEKLTVKPKGTVEKMVRQSSKYFVHHPDNKIIHIRLQYYGKPSSIENKKIKWDFESQFIDIALHSFKKEKYSNIMTLYKNIGLDCK